MHNRDIGLSLSHIKPTPRKCKPAQCAVDIYAEMRGASQSISCHATPSPTQNASPPSADSMHRTMYSCGQWNSEKSLGGEASRGVLKSGYAIYRATGAAATVSSDFSEFHWTRLYFVVEWCRSAITWSGQICWTTCPGNCFKKQVSSR